MNETSPIKIPPPVSIEEGNTGVHMQYMRRDIDEVKGIIKVERIERQTQHDEVMKKLDEMTRASPTRTEFNEFKVNLDKDRVEIIEKAASDAAERFVAKVEQDKINEKVDTRVTWLERIGYGGVAILGALEFYFQYLRVNK